MAGGDVFIAGDLVVGSSTFNQHEGLKMASGLEQFTSFGGGVNPKFVGSLKRDARINFVTHAIAKLLGELGFASALVATTDMYALKAANGGSIASGSVHTKYTLKNAHGIIRRLSARQGEPMTGEAELVSTYDGTNDTVAVATSQAAPAAVSDQELFTLGPVYFGTTLVNVQSVEIDTGIQDEQSSANGEIQNQISYFARREPKVTISAKDLASATAARFVGEEQAVTIFFRALTENSGTYADASAVHIKVVIAKASVTIDGIDLESGQSSDHTIMIAPVDDGTNAIVEFTVDQAIVAPV